MAITTTGEFVPFLTPSHLESYAEVFIWALRTSRALPFKNGNLVLLRFDVNDKS